MRCATAVLLLAVSTTWAADPESPAAANAGPLTTEPTVAQHEQQLLQRAESLSQQDHAAAIRILEQADTVESSAAIPFAIGAFYVRADQPAKAVPALRAALQRATSFHRARLLLAQALIAAHKPREAAPELVRLIGTAGFGQRADVWAALGYARFDAGQFAAAEAAYRHALALDPTHPGVGAGLMRALLEQNRYAETRGLVRDELRRNPGDARLWRLLVAADLRENDLDRALLHLECSRRLGVADSEELAALADLYLRNGMLPNAMSLYQSLAGQLDPPIDRLLNAVECCLGTDQTDAVDGLLQQLTPRVNGMTHTQQARFWRSQAELARNRDRHEDARGAYDKALQLDPVHGETLLRSGSLYCERGHHDQARTQYNRATAVPEVRFRAFLALAELEAADRRFAAAVVFLEKALRLRQDPAVERYAAQLRELLQ